MASCTCEFCTSIPEASTTTMEPERFFSCVSVTLPARVLETSSHTHGILYSVAPFLLEWKGKDKIQKDGSSTYDDLERLTIALKKHSGRNKVRFGIKLFVPDNNYFLVDLVQLVAESPGAFSHRDSHDTALTPIVYDMFPRYAGILKLTDKISSQVSKKQRVDNDYIIQLAKHQDAEPRSDRFRQSWSWKNDVETWTPAAVGRAILDASDGDVLPELEVVATENDGGFWCEITHPIRGESIKLLLSVVVLAWWRPYAEKVEQFILRQQKDTIRSLVQGERFVCANQPSEATDMHD